MTWGAGTPDGGLSRRAFGAGVLGAASAGTASTDAADDTDPTTDADDSRAAQPRGNPVEVPGWQVAQVRVEQQFTFVGVSAILYNTGETSGRTATLRYRLYGTQGRIEFEAEETASVPASEERHVARWWERNRPGTTTPAVSFADVEVLGVRS